MKVLSKISKKYKLYKKYEEGGSSSSSSDEESSKGSKGAAIAGAGIGIVTSAIGTGSTGNTSVGQGIATGAASGAAAGMAAGPWGAAIGGVVGGTVGGVTAEINSNKARRASQLITDANNKQNRQLAVLRGQQTPINGNPVYSLTERKNGGKLSLIKYPDGGKVYIDTKGKQFSKLPDVVERFGNITYPQTEDNKIVGSNVQGDSVIREGELQDTFNRLNPKRQEILQEHQIMRTPTQISALKKEGYFKEGGKLNKLSNNTVLATGASHEQGGIKIPQLGAEVEGGETLKKLKDGGTYVMSDTLKNPETGNTFAKDDLRLSKMKGKLENINHSFSKNALSLLKNKEQKLVSLHEQVRQEEGLESANSIGIAANGGKFSNTRTAYATQNPEVYPDGKTRYSQIGLDIGDPTYNSTNPYPVTDPNIQGKFMDNPDVEGIDGVAPTKSKNKFNTSNLSKLTPYIDNVTAAIYNNQRSNTKLPNLNTLTYLNPKHVNYGQAIKDTRDTITAYNRGVDTTNVNQGNANVMKAFALGKQQQAIAGISQEEANQNVEIDNNFAGRNKEIEKYNNETLFNNAERNRLGTDDIRREGQQNFVDANMKFQNQLKSKNQEADDKDAELQYDDRTKKYINSKKSRNGGKLSKLKISY